MKKIKIECWWTNTNSIHHRFMRQFVFEKDLQNYEFVESNPDFTIVFGRTEWEKIETPKERTFYFSQEPLWSPNQPKDIIHDFCNLAFVSDVREYPQKSEYVETLIPMLYSGRGEMDSREEWDWSTKIKNKTYQKNKLISIIVRKDYCSYYNHLVNPLTSKINYETRTNLGIELSKNKNIDIFGTNWENNGENIKGEAWNKHVGLDEYKFSIGCENTIQKNYVSEKFWDIVITDTIPIYLGCSNITDYIPEDYFISLNNKSLDEINNQIKDIIENENFYFQKYHNKVLELKQEFFNNPEYNLWEKIKLIVE